MALTLEKLRSLTTSRLAAASTLPVGVDFGTSALKMLQVTSPEAPALVAAAMVPTPPELLGKPHERLEFQVEALGRVLRAAGFRGKRVVCGVPSGQTACRLLRLQGASGPNLHPAIRAAIPAQLGCDPSAVVYRHAEVSGGARAGGKAEVILLATARELVERLVRAVRSARLEPVGIHNEFSATLASLGPGGPGPGETGATLYLDIGAGFTRALIAHGPTLVFAKTIEVGGRHLDALAAAQLGVGPEEARSRRLAMAAVTPAPDSPGPAADLREPLEMLTDEVSACLRFHESACPERRVERVVFLGGESRHAGLCQHVARAIRLPGQAADPMSRVTRAGGEPCPGADLSGPQPGWALALGLCLSPTDL